MTTPDPAAIARGLSKAQRKLVLRPPGIYRVRGSDILALLDAEILGTVNGPNYAAVKAELERQSDEG